MISHQLRCLCSLFPSHVFVLCTQECILSNWDCEGVQGAGGDDGRLPAFCYHLLLLNTVYSVFPPKDLLLATESGLVTITYILSFCFIHEHLASKSFHKQPLFQNSAPCFQLKPGSQPSSLGLCFVPSSPVLERKHLWPHSFVFES